MQNYIHGSKFDQSEKALKRFTYLFSFLLFSAKIVLSISLYIQYYKATIAKKNEELKQSDLITNKRSLFKKDNPK